MLLPRLLQSKWFSIESAFLLILIKSGNLKCEISFPFSTKYSVIQRREISNTVQVKAKRLKFTFQANLTKKNIQNLKLNTVEGKHLKIIPRFSLLPLNGTMLCSFLGYSVFSFF